MSNNFGNLGTSRSSIYRHKKNPEMRYKYKHFEELCQILKTKKMFFSDIKEALGIHSKGGLNAFFAYAELNYRLKKAHAGKPGKSGTFCMAWIETELE